MVVVVVVVVDFVDVKFFNFSTFSVLFLDVSCTTEEVLVTKRKQN